MIFFFSKILHIEQLMMDAARLLLGLREEHLIGEDQPRPVQYSRALADEEEETLSQYTRHQLMPSISQQQQIAGSRSASDPDNEIMQHCTSRMPSGYPSVSQSQMQPATGSDVTAAKQLWLVAESLSR
jgi:hypothetical protein